MTPGDNKPTYNHIHHFTSRRRRNTGSKISTYEQMH